MKRLAFISGVSGLELLDDERSFFQESQPLGLILFARNIRDVDQVKRLISEVREAVGAEKFWVLIDQEGGRVQRLKPPLFPNLPPLCVYGDLYDKDPEKAIFASKLMGQFMGSRLLDFGINVNCTPVLDAAQPGAHDIISDRSYGLDVAKIAALGRSHSEGHMQAGVLPVIKHIPGHGRALVDSHLALPTIDADLTELALQDFEPFRLLNDMPLAMTAHVILKAVDQSAPVSTSATAISEVIRGSIGYDGFLMCDDVSMQALEGSIGERTHQVMAAGCDGALHCNGILSEMVAVAEHVPFLQGAALERFERSFDVLVYDMAVDEAEALTCIDELFSFSACAAS